VPPERNSKMAAPRRPTHEAQACTHHPSLLQVTSHVCVDAELLEGGRTVSIAWEPGALALPRVLVSGPPIPDTGTGPEDGDSADWGLDDAEGEEPDDSTPGHGAPPEHLTLLRTAETAVRDGAGLGFGMSAEVHPVHGTTCALLHGCDASARMAAMGRPFVASRDLPGAAALPTALEARGGPVLEAGTALERAAAHSAEGRWLSLAAFVQVYGRPAGLRVRASEHAAFLKAGMAAMP